MTTTHAPFSDRPYLPENKQQGNHTSFYTHPPAIIGHVHIAKTGGTYINSLLANKYERVCGHKGYTYDAYQVNEGFKKGQMPLRGRHYGRSRVHRDVMNDIGYENCDYVSHEIDWRFWNRTFAGGNLHGVPVELHVPCRDPIDHLMSQCNHGRRFINCGADSDEALFNSVRACLVFFGNDKNRFHRNLLQDFSTKCYDFANQFTSYTDYMSGYLQKRRFESTPFVKRETNAPRNKTNECIWSRPDLQEKTVKYLKENVHYYEFCDQCIGSVDEIARAE